MYVYMYVYVDMYVYIYIYMYVCIYLSMSTYIYIYISTGAGVCAAHSNTQGHTKIYKRTNTKQDNQERTQGTHIHLNKEQQTQENKQRH